MISDKETIGRHDSARANCVLGNLTAGAKLHEVCLPRSMRNPLVTERAEIAARAAAAKLCQQQKRRIVDVWTEDGMHAEFGMYRMFYVVTVPDGKAH